MAPPPARPRIKRRDLERSLESVPDFPDPKAEWEQYRTPAPVAADLLWQAHMEGALAGRRVVDLGCGTGMFALGAVLLGASEVVGVERDEGAAALARTVLADACEGGAPWRVDVADVVGWQADAPFDVALMNPPFGAQKANRNADRAFYEAALAAIKGSTAPGGGSVWFLAQPRTERFLASHARTLGARVERVAAWQYPIEARFDFHDATVRRFEVGGYRMALA